MREREGSLEQQHDDKIVMKILSVLLFIEILPLGGKQIGNISQQEQKVGLNIL